jgi:filamentous hemagglutinin family protein
MELLVTTALTSSLLAFPAIAQNLPTGANVAAGSVSIAQPSATQMTITQSSASAVVNYNTFSIGAGHAVNIQQPSANAALLSRVTGNTPSTIAGSLTANGQVYLVNPNGIAITSTGTVKVGGGFVASTLGISDTDFMNGKRTFSGNGASKPVSNAGTITVGRGGYAALIGGTVENSGSIEVPLGKVGLGSGEQAALDFSGDGFLQVAAPTGSGGNDALIKQSGRIKADGGSVVITAATAREAARNAINLSGHVQARSISGRSGSIVLGGGAGGRVAVSGKLTVASRKGRGGAVTVTGRDIALAGATIDASGKTGGGTVRIGGDWQGKGNLQRAASTTIDAATTIKADATGSGNGGKVVVWSDQATRFAGTITARGGAAGGNGGDAEVSGKATLAYTGFTDLSAAKGAFGTLLLDPYNVIISNGTDTLGTGPAFTASANDSVINAATLQTALAGANVTISTGGGGGQAGDITVSAPVTWSSGATLTLDAYHSIAINAPMTIGGAGGLALVTNHGGTGGTLTFAGGVQYTGSGGSLTINGTPYTLLYDLAGLQNINSAVLLSGNYALAKSLDATGFTGWTPPASPAGRRSAPTVQEPF